MVPQRFWQNHTGCIFFSSLQCASSSYVSSIHQEDLMNRCIGGIGWTFDFCRVFPIKLENVDHSCYHSSAPLLTNLVQHLLLIHFCCSSYYWIEKSESLWCFCLLLQFNLGSENPAHVKEMTNIKSANKTILSLAFGLAYTFLPR